MPVTHKNRVVSTISNTPGASGDLTLSTAQSGYRTLGSGDDTKTFDVLIVDGTAWEVRTACTYTHSGTSLARGTLEDSSTGSAITLTSAAIVTVTPTAAFGNSLENALESLIPGGRLTLTSGTPVTTSDVTAATSVYYTPYAHDVITLWDGAEWRPVRFSEATLALGTLTSGRPYDVFAYLSSGALALESLVWTSDTARATAVTLQDGRYCKSGDKTRLLLGTFRTTSTTQTEDSQQKRFLSNVYNQAVRTIYRTATGGSYNGAERDFNNNDDTLVEWLLALPAMQEVTVYADVQTASAGSGGKVRIKVDGGTTSSEWVYNYINGSVPSVIGASISTPHGLAAGYHYAEARQESVSLACTFNRASMLSRVLG